VTVHWSENQRWFSRREQRCFLCHHVHTLRYTQTPMCKRDFSFGSIATRTWIWPSSVEMVLRHEGLYYVYIYLSKKGNLLRKKYQRERVGKIGKCGRSRGFYFLWLAAMYKQIWPMAIQRKEKWVIFSRNKTVLCVWNVEFKRWVRPSILEHSVVVQIAREVWYLVRLPAGHSVVFVTW
jgi:hypothetical protein